MAEPPGRIAPDPGDGLASRRLILRRFAPDDLGRLAELYADERVAPNIGGLKTREETRKILDERILRYYDEHPGLGIWATLERGTGDCVGMHLLNHVRGESFIQVGYALYPRFWGRGYATEMCVALLRYGFATRGLPQIVAIANLPNVASHRVLLKAGLHRRGERRLAQYADQGPLAWFERDRDDWMSERV